jgi:membrane-associated phospholipid phosphatase
MRGMGVFAGLLVVLLAVGTFQDYQIAQAIYAPGNPVVIFVSTMGLLAMAYPACLLLGVLTQRSLASQKSRVLCIVGVIACVLMAAAFGALVTKSFLSMREGLGGIVGFEFPTMVRLGIGAVVGVALCALGFNAGKANGAKELARDVLVVVAVIIAAFAVVELVKNFMSRPRPRLVLAGHEGIEFCPWYGRFSGAGDYIAAGIDKDDFKSFPSGHSLQAAFLLASFYGLSLVYPALRERLNVFLAVEIVFALTVMSCRMILGAHFLSDVSMGALVSVASFLVLMVLVKRSSEKPQLLSDEKHSAVEES